MAKDGPTRVYILDDFGAGEFAGREGESMGWSTRISDIGPMHGLRKGRDVDLAISVYFEDTEQQGWFASHLVKKIDS
jgi:hypothetical protein